MLTVCLLCCCFLNMAGQAKLDAAEFKVGDMIDCKDTANNWCQARIMDRKDVRSASLIFYGSRVHCSPFGQQDKVLVHYSGWSEKWDEWLNRKDKRIAP